MDGNYHQKNQNQTLKINPLTRIRIKKKIEKWLQITICQDKGYLRCDDIHIDQISKIFSKRERWILGAEYCLRVATEINSSKKLPFTILAAISLRYGEKPFGINFKNFEELEKELDEYTPPSLYAFPVEGERKFFNSKMLRIEFLNFYPNDYRILYSECKDSIEEEFSRTLWLEKDC